MCNFKSALVLANGDIYWNPFTDSHQDLIEILNIDENKIVKVEYSGEKIDDTSTYELKIDQDIIPDWFDEKMRMKTEKKMQLIVSKMIITNGNIKILCGSQYIISGDAKINNIKSCKVESICDNAQVEYICGNAQVESIYDNARVKYIRDNAQVEYIRDNAQIINDRRENNYV